MLTTVVSKPKPVKAKKGKKIKFVAAQSRVAPNLQGEYKYDFADYAEMTPMLMMYTLGHQTSMEPIKGDGLRYHGCSPIISWLRHKGRGVGGLPLPEGLPPGGEGGRMSQRQSQLMTLNIGPQHPSTHGVLRLVVELDGEVIVRLTPDIGYLHRGIGKIAESLHYEQFLPYNDRLDYLASFINNLGWALAVEKLLGIAAPPRANYLRVLLPSSPASRATSSGSARTSSTSARSRRSSTPSASGRRSATSSRRSPARA